MPAKNLHSKPFDDGTITKLEIFEKYAEAWIPTFVMMGASELHIFDFFAGPGYDINDVTGTPIRLIKTIEKFQIHFLQKKSKVVLHLNELYKEKFLLLEGNCNAVFSENPKFKYYLEIRYYRKDAKKLFEELFPIISSNPSLVFLDQNGIKLASQEYFDKFSALKKVDFLYFISSSYFKWLHKTKEFKRVLDVDPTSIKNKYMHEFIVGKLVERLPANTELKIFPFSIAKNQNIFGIVFGSKSYAAVDKYLTLAWKVNSINGNANFDIEEDIEKETQPLLLGKKLPTKIEKFEDDFEKLILGRELKNNFESLVYTYSRGHIAKHAQDVMTRMKKEKKVNFDSKTPGISYQFAIKDKRIVDYEVLP